MRGRAAAEAEDLRGDFPAAVRGRQVARAFPLILAGSISRIWRTARVAAGEAAAGADFRDIFSGIFGGGRGAAAAETGPEAGTDLEYQVNVPFWTAIRGGVMRLNISRQDACANCHGQGYIEAPGKCPECDGTGQITQTGGRMKFNVPCPRCEGTGKNISTCPDCHGEGTVSRTEPLEVRIKAGTRDGQRIRLAGKGNAGPHGGAAGDLYVIIRTGEHPVFKRDGDDIYLTVPVSATEAALGAKIEVPDHRRAGVAEDSSGNAVRTEAAPAREGRSLGYQGRRARG